MPSSFGGYGGMRDNTGSMARGGSTGDIIPKGYRKGQLQQFTPEQMQLFQQLFGHVGPDSYLSRLAGGDQSLFDEMEAPAHRDFQGALGQLASRFSGMGTGGRHGSGFQNTATAAASNFAQDLQANRQNLQRQAINDLMGLSNQLLGQRPYDQFLVEKQQKPNYWAQIAGKFAGAIPGAVAGSLSGGASGATQGIDAGLSLFGGGRGNISNSGNGITYQKSGNNLSRRYTGVGY